MRTAAVPGVPPGDAAHAGQHAAVASGDCGMHESSLAEERDTDESGERVVLEVEMADEEDGDEDLTPAQLAVQRVLRRRSADGLAPQDVMADPSYL